MVNVLPTCGPASLEVAGLLFAISSIHARANKESEREKGGRGQEIEKERDA